jgi:hypothetical protein
MSLATNHIKYEEQIKPKVNRIKEIIKIKTETMTENPTKPKTSSLKR